MSAKQHIAAAALVFASAAVSAQQPPVIEINTSPAAVPGPTGRPVAPGAVSASGSSEMFLIVQQLQDEVRFLRGQVEELSHKLTRMETEQRDRYRDLDRRISSLMSNAQHPAPAAGGQTAAAAESAGVAAEDLATASAGGAEDGNGLQAYKDALALALGRDFDAAVTAFQAFVQDYPQSIRVANAHFWLGEVYLAQRQTEAARESFLRVFNQYPDHVKTPDAAYKLGVIYSELGDKAQSDKYLNYVLEKHPKSNVAGLARKFKHK